MQPTSEMNTYLHVRTKTSHKALPGTSRSSTWLIQPETLISKGVIPETLADSVLTERDFGSKALVEGPLTTAGQSLWQDGYATFQSGA